ncbi:hypothetical protein tpqmel_0368 [Candidatus Gastranaerophilus sp. (ex Termes propinquus)]|nr:hypothetical protein tpqmel_0368 [Candidatus Gastranaerophilus sp. (ex Termes propinquus)]
MSGKNLELETRLLAHAKQHSHLSPSIYIWDYSSGRSVEIDSEAPVSAASIIKIPILFEFFRQIEDKNYGLNANLSTKVKFEELYRTSGSGDMQYLKSGGEYTFDYLANKMITESDNTATNIILDYIGGAQGMNRALRGWGLENSYMSNWLPDLRGTNRMSAKDVASVLYNLDNPSFLSAVHKEQIKEYMGNVKNRSLLRAGLPDEAILLHKTGDIGTMLGDAGVVLRSDGRKYIIVVMAKRPFNDYSAREFVKETSALVYKNL